MAVGRQRPHAAVRQSVRCHAWDIARFRSTAHAFYGGSQAHVKPCYTLFVNSRNVTLALPEDLLRRVKMVAAKQDTSISALLAATLSQLADQEEGYAEARDAMLADLARGYDLGTQGTITWSRDSLHER